jgi:hypothetical protein
MTSVYIDGDKALFSSKMAVERFKRDLKNNDSDKLAKNDYFIPDCTYELVSKTDTEIKVKLIKKEIINIEHNNNKDALKQKIQNMRNSRTSQTNVKTTLKDKVPTELLDAYFNLLKVDKAHSAIHPKPDEVIANPSKYMATIQQTVSSFASLKVNNPITHYYKLLAKHLGVNNTPQQQNNIQQPTQQQSNLPDLNLINKTTQDFISRLKNGNTGSMNDEMANIYKQLGIDNNSNTNIIDDEMKNIFASLGINNETQETTSQETTSQETTSQETTLPEDDEMKKIYESLGITV